MSFSNSHFTYISQMLPAQPQTLQQLDTNIYPWPYCEAPNASAAFPSCPPATSHEHFPMYYQSVPYQGNSLAACPASFATMQNDKVLDISARRQKKGRAMQVSPDPCRPSVLTAHTISRLANTAESRSKDATRARRAPFAEKMDLIVFTVLPSTQKETRQSS